jgi:hypothetical protein
MLEKIKNWFAPYKQAETDKLQEKKVTNSSLIFYKTNNASAQYFLFTRKDVLFAIQDVESNADYRCYYNIYKKCVDFIPVVERLKTTISAHLVSSTIKVMIDEEKEDEETSKALNGIDFKTKIIDFFIESFFYGFGTIQIGAYKKEKNKFDFLTKTPQILINPTNKTIQKMLGNDFATVVDFNDPKNDEKSFFFLFFDFKGILSKCFNTLALIDNANASTTQFASDGIYPYVLVKEDGLNEKSEVKDVSRKQEIIDAIEDFKISKYYLGTPETVMEMHSIPSDGINFTSQSKLNAEQEVCEVILGSKLSETTNYRQSDAQMTATDLRLRNYEAMFEAMLDDVDFKNVLTYCGLDLTNKTIKLSKNIKETIQVNLEKIKVLTQAGYDISNEDIEDLTGLEVEKKLDYIEPIYMKRNEN